MGASVRRICRHASPSEARDVALGIILHVVDQHMPQHGGIVDHDGVPEQRRVRLHERLLEMPDAPGLDRIAADREDQLQRVHPLGVRDWRGRAEAAVDAGQIFRWQVDDGGAHGGPPVSPFGHLLPVKNGEKDHVGL
jgi:hypothetical protein